MEPKHHHLISFDNILRKLLFQNRFFKGINTKNQTRVQNPPTWRRHDRVPPVQAAGCVAGDHSAGNQRPMESVRWEKLTHLLVGCLLDFYMCDGVDQLPLFPYNRGWDKLINPIVGVYILIIRIPY